MSPRHAAAGALALVLAHAASALACPNCGGSRAAPGANTLLIALGFFMLLPSVLAVVVIRVVRKGQTPAPPAPAPRTPGAPALQRVAGGSAP